MEGDQFATTETAGIDIYEHLGVGRVINASGRMTNLGGSAVRPEVAAVMAGSGQQYVSIDELHRAVGQEIARLIGAEDAMVTTGAAAGIALMVAAVVAGDDLSRVQALPDAGDALDEIVIQAGHQVTFGAPVTQMVALGGGRPRPVGTVNGVHEAHLTGAFGARTAAFLFVQSHHTVQKGMLSLARCIALCRAHDVPVLIDAAAEEDLHQYTGSGADLVTFSGGKAIAGPTSGIVAGRAALVAACRAQGHGIGRPMKVGKETIAGLAAAVRAYVERDPTAERARQTAIVEQLLDGFSRSPAARPTRLRDEAGRQIERVGLQLDPGEAADLVAFLRAGDPPIFPRVHLLTQGMVVFDPRPLTPGDAATIVERVQAYFDGDRESADPS